MKKILMLLMPVAALLFAAGCAATERAAAADADAAFYRRAAGHLEENGSFYHIGSNTDLYRSLAQWMSGLRNAIAESANPEPVRLRLQGIAAGAELFCRLSGIRDCAGYAGSSRRITAADGTVIYRNRKYFAPVENASGLIWEGKNPAVPRLEWLGRLPAATVCAASFDVDPVLWLKAADRAGRGGQEADKLARAIFGVPASELLGGIAGEWKFYMVYDKNAKPFPWLMVLDIPDAGHRVFERIDRFAAAGGNGGGKAAGEVSFGSGSVAPASPSFLKVTGGRLVICSSPAAAKLYQESAACKVPQLKSKDSYRILASGMPERSAGIFYSDFSGTADEVVNLKGVNVRITPFDAPELEVFEFTPEREWVITGHSTVDLNSIGFSRLVLTPAVMTVAKLEAVKAAAKEERCKRTPAALPEQSAGVTEKKAADPAMCLSMLNDAAGKMLRYRNENGGKMPADLDAWLKDNLIICPAVKREFITLGEVPENAPENWPLVMDRPGNHGNSFNVLYLSGKCGRIELERQSSVKRMISALHSSGPYDEKILSELIRRADAADKKLNGSEKK